MVNPMCRGAGLGGGNCHAVLCALFMPLLFLSLPITCLHGGRSRGIYRAECDVKRNTWKAANYSLVNVFCLSLLGYLSAYLYLTGRSFKLWVMKVTEKCIHSKINIDNSSTYQTQITAISPVRWVKPKPPSPISALQSISLSDCCCLTPLAPFSPVLGILPAGSSFMVRPAESGEMLLISKPIHLLFTHSIHPSGSEQNSTKTSGEAYTQSYCPYKKHTKMQYKRGKVK